MKSFIKSKFSKVTVLLLFIFVLTLSLMLPSCQEGEFIPSFSEEIETDYLLNGNLDVFVNAEQVTRFKGKPGYSYVYLWRNNITEFENCFILNIALGANSSGPIFCKNLNFEYNDVLKGINFTKNTPVHQFEICNLNLNSYIELELTGAPGAYLDIWVEGKRKPTEIIFNPEIQYGELNDIEGNIYKTVNIGDQTWMAENLRTITYKDGTGIPLITDDSEWANAVTPAYCWLFNDESRYKLLYGAIYNWHAVNTGKLCPDGWRVPSEDDFTVLENFLGGQLIAGGKLKETGTNHWGYPNTDATNETGFTALPGGARSNEGMFGGLGQTGVWWSSTHFETTADEHTAMWRTLEAGGGSTYSGNAYLSFGTSVRCIKNN